MRCTHGLTALTITAVLLAPACDLGPDPGGTEKSRPIQLAKAPSVEVKATPDPAAGTEEARTLSLKHVPNCRAVDGLLHAQRFTLEEPHEYKWMKDHPAITEGTLVVIEVNPECARPRQAAMPVLYAGDVPVEIAVDGYPSGRLVAFIPGHVDLTKTPLFYGAPDLPERVDAERGSAELTAAIKVGINPFPTKVVTAAQDKGGSALHLTGTTELYGAAAELAEP
ncbi:MAG: hypothetical protein JRG91_18595 [Deltaproteobacteria bacterium]|nr:hypothetical protein [Deltaproteobacteria bacterium]